MQPLDWSTRMKVTDACIRAKRQGRDVAEYLHSYGLLATPQWQQRVEADAIAKAVAALENVSVSALLGSKYLTGNYSAQDVVAGFIDRLRELENIARKGEL